MNAAVQRVHFQDAFVYFKTHLSALVSLNVNRLSWAHLHLKAPVTLNDRLVKFGFAIAASLKSSGFLSSEKIPNQSFAK